MAFVYTEGQLRSVSSGTSLTQLQHRTIRTTTGSSLSYEYIWRTEPAVRTVTGYIARQIASLGIRLFQRQDKERERLYNHSFVRLLHNPLPGSKLTRYRLMARMVLDLAVYENAFWIKLRGDNGRPAALLPVPPWMVSQPSDKNPNWFEADVYRVQGNRGFIDVPKDRMVHFQGLNLVDPRNGMSTLESLRATIAESISASTFREQFWRNGARHSGTITRPLDAPPWSGPDRDRFTESWNAQFAGDLASAIYAGGTPLLEDGMTYNVSGVSPEDSQYVEGKRLTREEVAVSYWIPPRLVSASQAGDDLAADRETLYRDSLPPWLEQIGQDMQQQILYDLDPGASDGRRFIEFNLEAKLRGAFLEQAKVLSSAVGGPWMTRDEARGIQNLSSRGGQADELIVPLNVTVGGLASPQDTAPDEPDNEESNESVPLGFLTRMERSLAAAEKAGTLDQVNWIRWVTELAQDLQCSLPLASRVVDEIQTLVTQTQDVATAMERFRNEAQR